MPTNSRPEAIAGFRPGPDSWEASEEAWSRVTGLHRTEFALGEHRKKKRAEGEDFLVAYDDEG